MPFAVKATLQAMQSYVAASGYFKAGHMVGHPKRPVPAQGSQLFGAVYMMSQSVVALTLSTTIELHTVGIRVFRNFLTEPIESIQFELADAVSQIENDLIGEFDLGASIRNVDVGGQYGQPLRSDWGTLDLGGVMYDIVDITVPLIVDDSATLVA